MTRRRATAIAAVFLLLSGTLWAQNCPRVLSLRLAKAQVTSVSLESGAGLQRTQGATLPALPPFCRVRIAARPTSGSLVHIEIWLPQKNWNGRLLSSGNGGFAGAVDYPQLAGGLLQDFVSVNSDGGTSPATPEDGDALIGHPQQWMDWGSRAIHVMTRIAKQVTFAYYGKRPRFSYFRGCSTGGEQGLAEAQRYPDDYDGILSGAPANDRIRLHIAILWNFEALTRAQHAGLTQEKLAVLHQAVLRACPEDTLHGDGLLDPSRCAFNPQSLLCSEGHSLTCLNQAEMDAVQQIYTGPLDERGRGIYPGLEPGSELGWLSANAGQQGRVPFGSIFRWLWGAHWDWRDFNFDRDPEVMERELGPSVNATSVDLRSFSQLKHKLVIFHGWDDPLIAPLSSIRYTKQVTSFNEATARLYPARKVDTTAFMRLYMIPGLRHCSGGTAFNDDDLLSALMQWVEHDAGPEALRIKLRETNQPDDVLRVCPFPAIAKVGNGALPQTCPGP